MNHKISKGFTIIELLISMAIIVILSGIILTNLASSHLKARDSKRVSDIVQLQLALELYFDRCNQYPQLGSDGLMNHNAQNGCSTINGTQVTFKDFQNKLPVPIDAGDYLYAVNNTSAPTDYVLRATLEKPNSAIEDDVDGTINYTHSGGASVSCGPTDSTDTYFCVQPR